jgi:hypothetical protein
MCILFHDSFHLFLHLPVNSNPITFLYRFSFKELTGEQRFQKVLLPSMKKYLRGREQGEGMDTGEKKPCIGESLFATKGS